MSRHALFNFVLFCSDCCDLINTVFYENHLCTENREFISFLDRLRPIETSWSYNGIEISVSLFKESSDFVFKLFSLRVPSSADFEFKIYGSLAKHA